MDQNDQHDNLTGPTRDGVVPEPPRIVEATPVPEDGAHDDTPATTPLPGAAVPGAVISGPGTSAPTEAIPVAQAAVVPPVMAPVRPPVVPVHRDNDPLDGRNPGWPYFLAFVALLAGGLVGYFLAVAGDDDDAPPAAVAPAADTTETLDLLLDRTRADGEYVTPSEYPQMDEITEIDSAAAVQAFQADLDELAAAQDAQDGAAQDDVQADTAALTEQVEGLEAALADMTAERDALVDQMGDTDGAVTDQQAALDAANDQIAELEDQLAAAVADLEAANANLADAENALQTAVDERDTAVETVEGLNIIANPSYINAAVTRARTDASANGWTLIEQPVESTTVAAGNIVDQAPPAGSNMIQGSVLYVTVAERP